MKSPKGLFITGTDTDVGKTFIGCQLLQALKKQGLTVVPRKPVETGCHAADGDLVPGDGTAYSCATGGTIPWSEITRYRFEPAISPDRAMLLADQEISVEALLKATYTSGENDFVLVEGAGGFYSPLCSDGLNADLASALGLPVLLVVKDQLGCVNHTLLSLEAIKSRGLDAFAIVLNQSTEETQTQMSNAENIRARTEAPVFIAPKLGEMADAITLLRSSMNTLAEKIVDASKNATADR